MQHKQLQAYKTIFQNPYSTTPSQPLNTPQTHSADQTPTNHQPRQFPSLSDQPAQENQLLHLLYSAEQCTDTVEQLRRENTHHHSATASSVHSTMNLCRPMGRDIDVEGRCSIADTAGTGGVFITAVGGAAVKAGAEGQAVHGVVAGLNLARQK